MGEASESRGRLVGRGGRSRNRARNDKGEGSERDGGGVICGLGTEREGGRETGGERGENQYEGDG